MHREARATWRDGPYSGNGIVSSTSGTLNNNRYLFGVALNGAQTSPGELLAAAIASSVSRMVSLKLANLGATPVAIETEAGITFANSGEQWRINSVHLEVAAEARSCETAQLEEAVEAACQDCPILGEMNLRVTHTARLVTGVSHAA